MSVVKTIAKNTLALSAAKILGLTLSFVLVIYTARLLSMEDFGIYSFAFGITSFFVIFLGLGLDLLFVRNVSKNRKLASSYLANIFFLKLCAALFVFAALFLFLFSLGIGAKEFFVTLIVALALLLQSLYQSFTSYFQAFQRMEFEAFVVSLQSILFFAVGSATLFFGLGLAGLVNAFLLVNLIVLFFAFFLLSKNFRLFKARVDFALWHALVISAFPFLAVGVLDSIFSQLSVVFLSLLSDNVSAALFSAPYKLVVALTILQSNFFVALFPVFSRFFHSKKKSFSFVFDRSAKYVLAFSLPVVAFVFIFSQKIILLFFGPKYFSVSSGLLSPSFALQLMIFVVPLWFLGGIANYALFSAHRQNDVVLSLALAAIAGIALNLFLIPRFLVAGACIALVVSSFISFVVSFYFALLRVHNANILVYFFKTFAATAILYVVLFFSYSLPLAANLFSTIVIYLALVFVFGLFDATDLRIFRQVFLFWKK